MTPYEFSLIKRLKQAIELSDELANRVREAGVREEAVPEGQVLKELIAKIDYMNQQVSFQLQRYWKLAETRSELAFRSEKSIRKLNLRLWEDVTDQFRDGTVANDLLKVLYQRVQHFPLPPFPITRLKPASQKDIKHYEDSYMLLGQHFGWQVDLLEIVRLSPKRLGGSLPELKELVTRYKALSYQVTQQAELLQEMQLTTDQLYRDLSLAITAVRGRMLVLKRDTRRVIP